jgi:hypothetical protein
MFPIILLSAILISHKLFSPTSCVSLNKEFYAYEQKLLNKMLKNYDHLLRPSGTVQVKLGVNLIQIIEILEKDQIMVINAFIDHKVIHLNKIG